MVMKIFQGSIFNTDAGLYFDRDLMQVMDSHQEYLKTAGKVTFMDIPEASLGNYKGDFFAVLTDFQIAPKYHRIIMQLNGFTSPTDYAGTQFRVLIPDIQVIETIAGVYMTGRSGLRLNDTQR